LRNSAYKAEALKRDAIGRTHCPLIENNTKTADIH